MALRSHWNGYLKLSLVSCPIALYPAISAAERISFRQVNKQTGNRLRQQLVDTVTGEVVQSENKGHGYQVGERELLMIEEEELEAARRQARERPLNPPPTPSPSISIESSHESVSKEPRGKGRGPQIRREKVVEAPEPPPPPIRVLNNRTIELERCIPVGQIDARYLDTPYYIAPRDEVGLEVFAVIRDAMRNLSVMGLGHVVLAKRERPIIIEPMENGLCGMTLRYTHEVRDQADYFARIASLELPEEMLRVAEHILETKTSDFDTRLLEDRYRTALVSMLRDKQAELPKNTVQTRPSRENVINLMEALKRSLEKERPIAKPKQRKGSPARSKRRL